MIQRAALNAKLHPSGCLSRFVKLFAILLISSFSRAGFSQDLTVLRFSAPTTGEQIQKALDGLSQGGEVALAAGTYVVREPLILRHNHVTLRGAGETTVLHLADGANCPVVILGAPGNPKLCPIDHLQLTDLLIDGNRKNQQVELWHAAADGALLNNNGIDIWRTADAEVSHVTCCHCRSGGLVSAAGTRRLTVNDFAAFDNQFDGLACYRTEDSHFSHLRLHDNLSAGISLDLNFNHNVIEDAELANNDLGIFMRSAKDNSFQQLTISQSRHHGVFMAQSVTRTRKGWQLEPGTECTGNSFNGLAIDHCGGKAFFINNPSCTNNVIAGAHFQGNVEGGFAGIDPGAAGTHQLAQH